MSVEASLLSVPLGTAITWTTNWRNSDHFLTANSFIFKAEDFRKILQEPSVEYVRVYLGLKVGIQHTPGHEQNILEEKLLCVGADRDQKDILKAGDANIVSGVYDFSHPCPPLCEDAESPLAGGEQ
ncbi:hypothetical protein [Longitalea arenae]|uniref:hypothetical protein n=1 Tax=Longitalea arenae TaxID=2812558 RepID=UPI001967EEBF|nr:hypothetical protein [Longitalea arenae]